MRNTIRISAALVLPLLISSCGGDRSNAPLTVSPGSIQKAITEFTDQSLIPVIQDFNQQAATLNTEAQAFCSTNTDSATLTALQTQWQVTTAAWYKVLPFKFGPMDDNLLDPRYRYIDYFRERGRDRSDAVRTKISAFIAGSSEFSAEFSLAYEVGLMPLELALFENNATQSTANNDILSEYTANNRKCTVLTGLTSRLAADANYLLQGWQNSYLSSDTSYRDLFTGNQLSDGSQAIDTLLVSVQEYLDYLPKRDVISAASLIADNGWDNARSSIDMITQMLQGKDNTELSLFGLMNASGYDVAVNNIKGTLIQARLHLNQQDAVSFYADSATLDGYFKRDIPDALKIQLGINFTDGD